VVWNRPRTQLREKLQGVQESFGHKIDARTDEILRRFQG
jgi:hypothetical protein